MDELIRAALGQGLGYALFVFLLMYVLKTTGDRELKYQERELKYQDLLNKMTDKFNVVEDIKEDVKEIKSKIEK